MTEPKGPQTRSVWLATAEMPSFRPAEGELRADVVVIGGGVIGLTTALLLADDGADVVLIEAREVGGRTSGHTTGKVTSQHGAIYAELVDRHGRESAKSYAAANQAAIDRVADLAVLSTLSPIGTTGGFFAKTRPRRSWGIAVRLPVPAPAGMAISIDDPVRSTRPWPGGGPNGLIVVGSGPASASPTDADANARADTAADYQALLDWTRSTWDSDAIDVDYRWSAHDYATPDQLPYVGRTPGSERILVATGMNKWGLTNGTVAAEILRDLVTGDDNPYQQLFRATRIGGPTEIATLIKNNLAVGKDLTTGRLSRLTGGTDHLEIGEGGLLATDHGTVGAYRDHDGNLHTVKPVCTHLGCAVTWNQADTTWDCSCHGSRFSPDGIVLDGPATTPLQSP